VSGCIRDVALSAAPAAPSSSGSVRFDRVVDVANDGALMAAVVERADRGAFAQIFRRYAPRVKAYLMARGATSGVADELTQEAMLLVWRKASLFDPAKGNLATWLFTISRNCLVNHVRRAGRPIPEDDLVPDQVAGGQATPDVEQQMIGAEAARLMIGSIERLPAEQREILVGAYWNGKTLQECADQARIPVGTAKTRLRLALVRLREMIHARSKE